MYLECILTVSYYPCSCSGATTVVASISRAYTEGMRQALCTLRLRGEHLGRGNLPAPQIHEQSSSSIAPLASSCLCNSSTCTRPGSFRPSAAAGPTQHKHPDPAWGRPRRKPAFAVARSQPPAQARTCRRARSVRGSQTGPRVSGLARCAAAEGSRYLTESSPWGEQCEQTLELRQVLCREGLGTGRCSGMRVANLAPNGLCLGNDLPTFSFER